MLKEYDFCSSAFRGGGVMVTLMMMGMSRKEGEQRNVILGYEVAICTLLSGEVLVTNNPPGDLLRMGC
jgi:hypothetical protein